MKAHMTNKMLKSQNSNCRVFEGNLNTNRYDKDTLIEKVCSHCLLKSFKTTDVILIKEVTDGDCSHCTFHLDSTASLNTNANSNKPVILS